jgi:hypothetical protein
MKIKCQTLFDITKTNITNRRRNLEAPDNENVIRLRNQQSNFETLVQVISMRSQPENITDPVISISSRNQIFTKTKLPKDTKIWSFTFTVESAAVYRKNEIQLGNLVDDCQGVPMITGLDETKTILSHLDSDTNITFEVIDE